MSNTTAPKRVADEPAFNLRAFIRDTLANSTVADPHVLAGIVLAKIPRKQYEAALTQALGHFVRQVITEERSRTGVSFAEGVPSGQGVSWKSAAGKWWRAELRKRYPANGEQGDWKLLGDFTVEDCHVAAAYRREQAARNSARAEFFDAVAAALIRYKVERVRDLPEIVLDELDPPAGGEK